MMRKRKRDQTDVRLLSSKYVPYVRLGTSSAARPFLPTGPDAVPTVALVRRFLKASRRNPELRLIVLGTLRAHSTNGAEAPLAAGSVLFAALSVIVAVTVTSIDGWSAWLIGIAYAAVMVTTAVSLVRMSIAAHARRVIAVTWLGAYMRTP